MKFKIKHSDPGCSARSGIVYTDHGEIRTPAFMPVGTQGTVKTLSPQDITACDADIILGNTYHLYLRPGTDIIFKAGGLHKFISWDKPILTDSGGFQVFSLSDLNKITEDGVCFRSHLNGAKHLFTPENVIETERLLGADIIMPLDYPIAYPADEKAAAHANDITIKWAEISKNSFVNIKEKYDYKQFLFGIIQGSVYPHLRQESVESLLKIGFDGYAMGGLAVGEPVSKMYELVEHDTSHIPTHEIRYLMGVGIPVDLVTAVGLGVDMFDCVMPTRNARNGTVFTFKGKLTIKNAKYSDDFTPLDENCNCFTCNNFTRAYLRHLFIAGEILALRLLTFHSIYFYQELMHDARNAIKDGKYTQWKNKFLKEFLNG